ncbi:hypothetical protein GCM10022243_03990 [Saccharothrix violaceirubra]|uniref:Uncharacterized protein n=1 Tax=Saccharothrix violaceirubra TaxID=413306 RepID=A0A7W7WTT2_9PSEU|nr:hypothetical protein [Saccharothrix violaceirubra]MBB4962808.1 hypothetical protein [Saccharothrix violaceirubra]
MKLLGVIATAAVVGAVAVGTGNSQPGSVDDAWQGLGLKIVRKASHHDPACPPHTFGEVNQLMATMPCVSLSRTLMTLADDKGTTIVVHIAWVEYGTRAGAREFKRIEDIHGTGDVSPLPGATIGIADVRFTAHHYDSTINGTTTVTAEAEPLTGQPDDRLLEDVTRIAVLEPRP